MRKKIYGASQENKCPFCSRQTIAMTKTGLPVCPAHTKEKLPNKKCSCGKNLALMMGKWGPYFNCINCGNINFKKGMSMPEVKDSPKPNKQKRGYVKKPYKAVKEVYGETTIKSTELDFL